MFVSRSFHEDPESNRENSYRDRSRNSDHDPESLYVRAADERDYVERSGPGRRASALRQHASMPNGFPRERFVSSRASGSPNHEVRLEFRDYDRPRERIFP